MTQPSKKLYHYPRKCPDCEYLANIPSTYCDHIKNHVPIPEGTLCSGGCGLLATIRRGKGRVWCQLDDSMCSGNKAFITQQTKKMWSDGNWEERKATLAARIKAETPEQRAARWVKQSATKREKLRAIESTLATRQYRRIVIYHSRKTYQQNIELINPNHHKIGLHDYHLEHKVSRHIGFLLKLPIEYMCSVHNLAVMFSKENSSKSTNCSLHPITLLELCGAPASLVTEVQTRIQELGDNLSSQLPQLNTLTFPQ